ncbi:MAG: RecQ family ATP-dependent DNA helicase [Treponemataceae bacterium]|nr:MAG: RecQ family ATP-dependent DNA helicase [Treponemataceae bacterium]
MNNTYDENEFADPVTQTAKKVFGVNYLYPWQRIVIANILDAAESAADGSADERDVWKKQIVLLPTGAGKSMCFLVPAAILERPTLIIYPLLALMADQKRRMDAGNLQAVVFRGGMSDAEKAENFQKIKDGAKIILANPEVLQSDKLLTELKKCNIVHAAIDEAHCTAEWGDSFRPAYLKLGEILQKLEIPVVTAFTATASASVLKRTAEVLFGDASSAHIVRSDSDRPNIHYAVHYAYAKEKAALECAQKYEKPLIVFCGTRKKSEQCARLLSEHFGRDAVRFYHAGLTREEKTAVEKWFFPKKDGILCATCAFGMGVDKSDIRTVIHLEAPSTAEAYIQEAGRGGRDGSIAQAVLLWSPADSERAKSFRPLSRERVMADFAESSSCCRRQVLLDALGGEQAPCAGCDVCLGHAEKHAADAKLVLDFFAATRRFHTLGDAPRIIEETLAQNNDAPHLCAKDIRKIIERLLAEKKLIAGRFWNKNRVMKVAADMQKD